MARVTWVAAALLAASCALAGGNPGVRVYIDFDPPNYVHSVSPEPYSTVDAYICLDNLGIGMTSVSLALTDLAGEYPGLCPEPSFTYLLPGDLPL